MKATRAPKLISAVAVTRSKEIAESATMPTMSTLIDGVRHFGWTKPKIRSGSTLSRPITYSRRDTLAWEARPDARVLMKVAQRKIDWNSLPPTYRAISGSAASGSLKRTLVGK